MIQETFSQLSRFRVGSFGDECMEKSLYLMQSIFGILSLKYDITGCRNLLKFDISCAISLSGLINRVYFEMRKVKLYKFTNPTWCLN